MGLTDKQIAELLDLSVHTVDSHWRHIRRKLGVPNRAAAVAAWLTGGRPAGGGGIGCLGFQGDGLTPWVPDAGCQVPRKNVT